MGCHFLLHGVFLIQGLNLCLLHWQVDSLLHHLGSSIKHSKRALTHIFPTIIMPLSKKKKHAIGFSFFPFFFDHTTGHVRSYFPDQGSNLHPLHWKCGILTTAPPGKSQDFLSLDSANTHSNTDPYMCLDEHPQSAK